MGHFPNHCHERTSGMSNSNSTLTQERLKEILQYDPETGIFTWLRPSKYRGRDYVGGVAGSITKHGYLSVMLGGVSDPSHRLAWLYEFGAWPCGDIDHKNGNTTDNRIANLRDVSTSTNCENRRGPTKFNKSGFLGVSPHRGRWKAGIRVKGAYHYLGLFDDPLVAYDAYLTAKRNLHEGCTI